MSFGPLPFNLYSGMFVGFFAVIAIASALNMFGDAMFRRGVARPFFLGRYRVHHRRFLYVTLPLAYTIISALVLAGYVEIVWSLLWEGIAGTVLVALDCLLLDMTIDYIRKGRGRGFIRHEMVYFAVPAFAFSVFLRFVV